MVTKERTISLLVIYELGCESKLHMHYSNILNLAELLLWMWSKCNISDWTQNCRLWDLNSELASTSGDCN